jgi:hypothetical protein
MCQGEWNVLVTGEPLLFFSFFFLEKTSFPTMSIQVVGTTAVLLTVDLRIFFILGDANCWD